MRSPSIARRTARVALAVGLTLAAVGAIAQTVSPRAAIDAANAKFSADFAKGDAIAVASHYTAAAWAFPPNGEIAKGREAIAKVWKGAMDAGIKQVKLTTLEVESHGDAAHEEAARQRQVRRRLEEGRRAVEDPPGHLEHQHAGAEVAHRWNLGRSSR